MNQNNNNNNNKKSLTIAIRDLTLLIAGRVFGTKFCPTLAINKIHPFSQTTQFCLYTL